MTSTPTPVKSEPSEPSGMPMINFRIIISAIVSPLVAPLLIVAPTLLTFFTDSQYFLSQVAGLELAFFIASMFSYLGFGLLGIPALLLVRQHMPLTLLRVCAVGAVAGSLVFILFITLLGWALGTISNGSLVDWAYSSAVGAVLGGAVALCFCLISGLTSRSRP